MNTAIIVATFNGRRWLKNCLASCRRFAPDVPVYVVDNASTDGSAELAATFSNVTVLKQIINRGFAGGNNVGIREAIKDGAETVMLLNQDAELTAGSLSALANYLATHPKVAAVQPAIMLPDGRVNSLGNSFHFLGFGEAGGNGLTMEEAKQRLPWVKNNSEPPYLSGAAVMLRAKALEQVGLFDEELFMYHEDLKLSLQLRAAGWQLAVLSEARAVHYYEPGRSKGQYYYMERNRLIVWNEIFQKRTLLLLLPFFILSEVVLITTSLFKGWFGQKLRSYIYFLRPASWYHIKRQRYSFMKLKQKSDSELMSYASATINYQARETGSLTRYFYNSLSSLVWFIIRPLIRW